MPQAFCLPHEDPSHLPQWLKQSQGRIDLAKSFIIFHQPIDFPEIAGVPFPFQKATFWGKSVVWVVWGRELLWPDRWIFWGPVFGDKILPSPQLTSKGTLKISPNCPNMKPIVFQPSLFWCLKRLKIHTFLFFFGCRYCTVHVWRCFKETASK